MDMKIEVEVGMEIDMEMKREWELCSQLLLA